MFKMQAFLGNHQQRFAEMIDARPRFEDLYSAALTDDLQTRVVLSAQDRFAVQLGGLAALGLGENELTAELTLLLAAGCAPDLAEDCLIQMAAYIGYPKTRSCLKCLERALANAGVARPAGASVGSAKARHQVGTEDYARLNPEALNTINAAFGDLAPDVIDLTFRIFGDVYAGSRQPLGVRQLATISALAVLGCAAPQLRFHIGAGLHVGLTQAQLVEVVAWVQFFAGAPAAYNALIELKAALAAGSSATPAYE